MIALDLFCGAGGASKGYADAGFEVIGIDNDPAMLENYPYEGHQMDWVDGLRLYADQADLIHASPPCQAYSLAAAGGVRRKGDHPDLIGMVRRSLLAFGRPYVIENVPQAPLLNPVTLCGTSFGLPVIRHRSFECSFPVDAPSCGYAPTARVRHRGYTAYPYGRKRWRIAWAEHVLPEVWPWMTLEQSGQAIPPAYTKFIGEQWSVTRAAMAA